MNVAMIIKLAILATTLAEEVVRLLRSLEDQDTSVELLEVGHRLEEANLRLKAAIEAREGQI